MLRSFGLGSQNKRAMTPDTKALTERLIKKLGTVGKVAKLLQITELTVHEWRDGKRQAPTEYLMRMRSIVSPLI